MHHPVEAAVPGDDPVDQGPHVGGHGDVGAYELGVRHLPRRGAPGEYHRGALCGEGRGERPAQAARATGDQVDTTGPERPRAAGRRVAVATHEPAAVVPDPGLAVAGQFGENGPGIGVAGAFHRGHGQARLLQTDGAGHSGHRRGDQRLGDVHHRHRGVQQHLGERQHLPAGGLHPLRQVVAGPRAEVHDRVRGAGQVGQQGSQVVRRAGAQLVLSLPQPPESRAAPGGDLIRPQPGVADDQQGPGRRRVRPGRRLPCAGQAGGGRRGVVGRPRLGARPVRDQAGQVVRDRVDGGVLEQQRRVERDVPPLLEGAHQGEQVRRLQTEVVEAAVTLHLQQVRVGRDLPDQLDDLGAQRGARRGRGSGRGRGCRGRRGGEPGDRLGGADPLEDQAGESGGRGARGVVQVDVGLDDVGGRARRSEPHLHRAGVAERPHRAELSDVQGNQRPLVGSGPGERQRVRLHGRPVEQGRVQHEVVRRGPRLGAERELRPYRAGLDPHRAVTAHEVTVFDPDRPADRVDLADVARRCGSRRTRRSGQGRQADAEDGP
ncbi:hypothetical protein EES47_29830 [Streptomyces sp. ADI98-12]|nr:hypothetical protein EES47_29830 [Streptomyces sp. ADI98-12]